MKAIVLILLCVMLNFFFTSGQTREIESENISRRFLNNEFSAEKYKKIGESWREAFGDKGYPELPYDSISKTFEYEFVINFDSIDKETIYNRILEYASIEYGYLGEVIDYQDYNLGKIIMKLRVPVNKKSAQTTYYLSTYRITILDYKAKFEIFDLGIEDFYDKYDDGEIIVTNYSKTNSIEEFFPITNSNDKYWKARANMLRNFDKKMRESCLDLVRFIRNYKDDYDF